VSAARICHSTTVVKLEPNHHCQASSELLFGESVQILEQGSQWHKVRSKRDQYEGYIETASCELAEVKITHWVSCRSTLIFSEPNIKSPVVRRIPFGSELSIKSVSTNTDFYNTHDGGFVWSAHCLTTDTFLRPSVVQVAISHYLQAPYLWGGRSPDGCDCSGMIQMVVRACGIDLPRDSIDQEQHLNSVIDYDLRAAEDIVFWPGHVGILETPDSLVHATAHSMQCCIEPLEHVIQRAGLPSSIKRLTL